MPGQTGAPKRYCPREDLRSRRGRRPCRVIGARSCVCVLDEMQTPEDKGVTSGRLQAIRSVRSRLHAFRSTCEDQRILSERQFKPAQHVVAASRQRCRDQGGRGRAEGEENEITRAGSTSSSVSRTCVPSRCQRRDEEVILDAAQVELPPSGGHSARCRMAEKLTLKEKMLIDQCLPVRSAGHSREILVHFAESVKRLDVFRRLHRRRCRG